MPLPTSIACSAAAWPGGQSSTSRALAVMSRTSVFPTGVVGDVLEGSRVERSRLGGVTSDMMSVAELSVAKVALGPSATPVTTGVVAVLPLVVGVAVEAVVETAGAAMLGSGTAPEVASGAAPGGGGAGPVVVVAMVEGDVEGVPVVAVDAADCPSAVLAKPSNMAAAARIVRG